MAPIRETLRDTANRVVNVVKQRTQLQYQDSCFKLETNARVFKQSIEKTAPYMVLTGLSKVRDSLNRTTLLPLGKKQQTHRNATTGRIEKPKRQVPPAERDFRWYDMKMKREASEMAREKVTRLREEESKMVEEKKRRQQLRATSDCWAMGRRASIRNSRPQWTEPPPSPPYVPEKSRYSAEFYASQTPEERRKFINERLTNILGEEKMKAPMLPSGHNPVDPVIAEHNQRVATASIMDVFEARRAEFQRHAEEQRCLAHEEQEAHTRTKVLYNHCCDMYRGRINKLAMYTGEMADYIDLLDKAVTNNHGGEFTKAVQVLTHHIFEPIHALLLECDKEIPLDVEGARMLKDAWPVARLGEVYEYLVNKADGLEPQVVFMAQLIEAIAKRINNPTTHVNPLERKEQLISDCHANLTTSYASAPGNHVSVFIAAPTVEGACSIGGRASTAGISKLWAVTKEHMQAGGGGQADSSPGSKIPSITVEPEDSVARQDVLEYISNDNMVLRSEIQDMFRNKEVKHNHRRAVHECIDGLMNAANGAESILGSTDAGHYRSQIEECVTRIDALALKIRQHKDIRALKKLCGHALRIWAIHE